MAKVQFMHFRPTDKNQSRGGATVAIMPTQGNKVLVSVALCSWNDVFNKKLGRQISEGRLVAAINGRAHPTKVTTSNERRTVLVNQIREIEVTDPMDMKGAVAKELAPMFLDDFDLV